MTTKEKMEKIYKEIEAIEKRKDEIRNAIYQLQKQEYELKNQIGKRNKVLQVMGTVKPEMSRWEFDEAIKPYKAMTPEERLQPEIRKQINELHKKTQTMVFTPNEPSGWICQQLKNWDNNTEYFFFKISHRHSFDTEYPYHYSISIKPRPDLKRYKYEIAFNFANEYKEVEKYKTYEEALKALPNALAKMEKHFKEKEAIYSVIPEMYDFSKIELRDRKPDFEIEGKHYC